MLDPDGGWTLGESVAAARVTAGKVQGRRTTEAAAPPIAPPDGDWAAALQTSWTEPAALETDASWATPGAEPASALANGGAFGAKVATEVEPVARELADEHGRAVRVRYSREDATRRGPKRPPLAAGLRADGTGVVVVARTEGVVDAIHAVLPDVEVVEVDLPGPPTSLAIRGAGWVEAVALRAALGGPLGPDGDGWVGPVTRPGHGEAWARVVGGGDGAAIEVRVDAGTPLDEVVLRSYCIGAAHQGASLVTSESIVVDDDGVVHDLTIRSFGILRAVDTPPIDVEIVAPDGEPVPVSACVVAAVAAAVWVHQGTPPQWPTGVPLRSAP